MAEYHLLTTWRVEAPLERVYRAIHDSLCWPDWWHGVQRVDQVAAGDVDGIDSVWRYYWRGRLPYQVVFDVRVTRVETLVAIEGTTCGDLEGVGRWDFARQGAVSTIRCEWHVHSTRWWMNLIAPVARSIFVRNHALVMEQGGQGLASLLGVPLVSQETVDLLAAAARPASAAQGGWRQQGRIDPAIALIVGFGAGIVATAVQLLFWWLAGMPVLEMLLRDARLTAALVMGTSVLPPPSTAHWDVLLVATLIHFALSVGYALIAVQLTGRLRTGPALVVGALYGLLIHAVNLYGLTVLFPWFAVARDWVTLVTHVVFGVTLAGGCRLLSKQPCDGARTLRCTPRRFTLYPSRTATTRRNTMNEYRHHVSGFFASKEEAQGAMARLVERGLAREQLQLFAADATPPTQGAEADSNKVLKNVLVDGAVGTAIGTGLGALAQVALVATNVSLFIASPLVAPLVMLGWGASMGAIVGAATGATTGVEKKDGRFADLIQDAIMNGQYVLLATTRNEQETTIAREVIKESVAAIEDVATA